ncbi:hypothetical protein QUA51_09785 [Microcoleus sp. Pol10_D6]|uniref:hypothetical protein n=1 Tax=Microcoleus sp. Pol10_D6 TaxID=2818875 RepID=UPI002FD689AF
MTTELSTKLRPDEICEKLGIGTSTYYNRLKYLGIEASRDADGPYLNAEQMKLMEELSEHIRQTGKMQGFGGGGQLALSESSGLASALEIPVQPEIPGSEEDGDGLEELIREAAELKVQQVAMPELIKLHLAAGMTEDDLPADLKAKLQAVRDAANPKPNAASIAQQLLQRHRNKNQQKNPETK